MEVPGAEGDTDVDLWARVQGGDETAFEQLFDRHSGRIYTYCARVLGSWDDAQDLVSIVFLHAWRRRGDVELVRDSLLPWLYGVADNTSRNHRRALLRHRGLVQRIREQLQHVEPNPADDVVERVESERRMRVVRDAIASLRKEEADLVRLCLLGELPLEQAAAALGIPVGTAKSRLSRARARLRAQLSSGPATRRIEPWPHRVDPAEERP